ncbi:MAG: DUF1257 domain-containing protein [Synechococcaceae bacterium WB4_1_0192]|jgi:hypothetical protein|nr:DUF1257 domain-containing protein [Synechococcaceae bacterium WB4_1_0192]
MSHFSTVKTELRDRTALIDALRDLGHSPCDGERPLRGYRGQTVVADLTIAASDDASAADIGFRWNAATASYELVTDLDLWRRPVPVERFLSQLTQRYALRSILAASAEEGFQVSEQRQAADGSIELVVTRWDG